MEILNENRSGPFSNVLWQKCTFLHNFFVAPVFRKQNKFILYVYMYVCMYVCILYVLDSSWEISWEIVGERKAMEGLKVASPQST